MRITTDQQAFILIQVKDTFGDEAQVLLFGSRVDDTASGGDVDLLVEVPSPVDHPALQSSRLAARISRYMQGRKIDVVVDAPNLDHLAIHAVAKRTGVRL
ncbi:MAG: putative nucleotidyltransferase [Motiliproteus sp.]|jgi:predicted nucleotidyltransferase